MAVAEGGQGKSKNAGATHTRGRNPVRALTAVHALWQASRVGEPNTRAASARGTARERRRTERCVRARVSARRTACWLGVGLGISLPACTPTSLDTIELGDNPETAELSLDEDFFHCEIQPKVLTAQGCASGGAGEASACHAARSALRLIELAQPSVCQDGRLVGGAAQESLVNLERVRSAVGLDADASPLYRRPLGLDSHPRMIFAADSAPAMLLRSWLNGQATP
jgi:hypothetical protein